MLVRNLFVKEKEAILELGRKIFREEDEIPLLRKALSLCSTDLSFVAIDKGTTNILGFSLVCSKIPTNYYVESIKKIPNCYELAFLGIDPAAQGKGIGTQLFKETLLKTANMTNKPFSYWLLVDTINKGAVKLYEKWGFRHWYTIEPPVTPLPGYIMGFHSNQLIMPSQTMPLQTMPLQTMPFQRYPKKQQLI